jgi:hypothetical protein
MKHACLFLVFIGCQDDPATQYRAFVSQLHESLCRRSPICAPSEQALATCRAQKPDFDELYLVEDDVRAGRVTFHPDAAQRCLEAASRSARCNGLEVERVIGECVSVVTGVHDCHELKPQPSPTWLMEGDACEITFIVDPCADGLACDGVCRPLVGIGHQCGGDGACDDGLRCAGPIATAMGPSKICLQMLRVGEACDEAADACEPFATCFSGVCAIVGYTEGDPCDDAHLCGAAFYCASNRCKAKAQLGESCEPLADSCAEGYCDARFSGCQHFDTTTCP